jgi:hypothetical protein
VILETSYGTHVPDRLEERDGASRPLRFLFVGSVDLRKGVLDLFDA